MENVISVGTAFFLSLLVYGIAHVVYALIQGCPKTKIAVCPTTGKDVVVVKSFYSSDSELSSTSIRYFYWYVSCNGNILTFGNQRTFSSEVDAISTYYKSIMAPKPPAPPKIEKAPIYVAIGKCSETGMDLYLSEDSDGLYSIRSVVGKYLGALPTKNGGWNAFAWNNSSITFRTATTAIAVFMAYKNQKKDDLLQTTLVGVCPETLLKVELAYANGVYSLVREDKKHFDVVEGNVEWYSQPVGRSNKECLLDQFNKHVKNYRKPDLLLGFCEVTDSNLYAAFDGEFYRLRRGDRFLHADKRDGRWVNHHWNYSGVKFATLDEVRAFYAYRLEYVKEKFELIGHSNGKKVFARLSDQGFWQILRGDQSWLLVTKNADNLDEFEWLYSGPCSNCRNKKEAIQLFVDSVRHENKELLGKCPETGLEVFSIPMTMQEKFQIVRSDKKVLSIDLRGHNQSHYFFSGGTNFDFYGCSFNKEEAKKSFQEYIQIRSTFKTVGIDPSFGKVGVDPASGFNVFLQNEKNTWWLQRTDGQKLVRMDQQFNWGKVGTEMYRPEHLTGMFHAYLESLNNTTGPITEKVGICPETNLNILIEVMHNSIVREDGKRFSRSTTDGNYWGKVSALFSSKSEAVKAVTDYIQKQKKLVGAYLGIDPWSVLTVHIRPSNAGVKSFQIRRADGLHLGKNLQGQYIWSEKEHEWNDHIPKLYEEYRLHASKIPQKSEQYVGDYIAYNLIAKERVTLKNFGKDGWQVVACRLSGSPCYLNFSTSMDNWSFWWSESKRPTCDCSREFVIKALNEYRNQYTNAITNWQDLD